MDLTTVRWFLAVAEQGHVTNAASELGLSQPGLSRAIARLERDVGLPLFDRQGRNVRLSRYGEVFAGHARRLVAEEEAARRALAQAADPEGGEVALAFLHTQGVWLVPDLLRRFRTERPRVRFRLAQDHADRLEEAVRTGAADLALTSPRPRDEALAWAPMVTERLRLAVPADHPLAARSRLRLGEAAGEPFVAVRRGAGVRAIFEELAGRAGFRPSVLFEGDELSTIRGLVAAGLGVAVVSPAPEGEALAGIAEIPLTDPGAERTIGLAWRADRTMPPAAEGFRRFTLERAAALRRIPPN
ncbi:LysR family transcriptional regulator [Actinomadura viridis]|uniref:DNA-binding transcriptional LysR family regulator n=1 Tax=Actinomadura viridis TaxID=58110 RepID=A0A931DHF5_9ACTN|nr:LysR family transcriptional regulator [Actinomadura viridis]MBG6086798.1 DNA-binding transcriptional LysR family regulator [Actinomadura viridis]